MKFTEIYHLKNNSLRVSHTVDTRGKIHKGAIHYHTNQYEINFIMGQKLNYILNQSEYELGEYNLVIIPPMCTHAIKTNVASPYYEAYNIQLDKNYFSNVHMDEILGTGIIIPCKKDDVIHNIYKKTDYYYKNLPEEDFTDMIYTLMKEVLYNAKISKYSVLDNCTILNSILSDAISYINDNFMTIKSISEIASALYVSERYLGKIFQKQLGVAPKKYLNQKRLSEAKSLLLKGVKSTEACYQTGFSDYTVFYRNYTGFYGHSPSKEKKLSFEA